MILKQKVEKHSFAEEHFWTGESENCIWYVQTYVEMSMELGKSELTY